jgi:PRTRC genetic system protein F
MRPRNQSAAITTVHGSATIEATLAGRVAVAAMNDPFTLPTLDQVIPAELRVDFSEKDWLAVIRSLTQHGILLDDDCPKGASTLASEAIINMLARLYGPDAAESVFPVMFHATTDPTVYWYGEEEGFYESNDDIDPENDSALYVTSLPKDPEARVLKPVLTAAYQANPLIANAILRCLNGISSIVPDFVTPYDCFEICQEWFWEGECDETHLTDGSEDDSDDGIRRRDWDAIPEWVFQPQIDLRLDLPQLTECHPEWRQVLELIAIINELSQTACLYTWKPYGPTGSLLLQWEANDVCGRVFDDMHEQEQMAGCAEMHGLFRIPLDDPKPGFSELSAAFELTRNVDRLIRLLTQTEFNKEDA